MGWSPWHCIPNFIKIIRLVPGIRILKCFYHLWAWWTFCHVTGIVLLLFQVPKNLYTNIWLKMAQWFWKKQVLIFKCKWPWAKVDLKYPYTFIYSISRLRLPTFRSQATVISKKSTVFTLSLYKSLKNWHCRKIGHGSNQSQLQILRRGGVFVTASRTALSDLSFFLLPFLMFVHNVNICLVIKLLQ